MNRYRPSPERTAAKLNAIGLSLAGGTAFAFAISGALTFAALLEPTGVPSGLWLLDGCALALVALAFVVSIWIWNRLPLNVAEQERLAEMAEGDEEVKAFLVRAIETYGALDRKHLEAAGTLFKKNQLARDESVQRKRAALAEARLASALKSSP